MQTVASQGVLRKRILEKLEKLFDYSYYTPDKVQIAFALDFNKYNNWRLTHLYYLQKDYEENPDDEYSKVEEVIRANIKGSEYFISFRINQGFNNSVIFSYVSADIFKNVTTKPDIMYSIGRYPNLYWLKDSVFVSDYSKLVAQETVEVSTCELLDFEQFDTSQQGMMYSATFPDAPDRTPFKFSLDYGIVTVESIYDSTKVYIPDADKMYRCPDIYVNETANRTINSADKDYCIIFYIKDIVE